jgi:Spy/CpxP family protein refolding chaperone
MKMKITMRQMMTMAALVTLIPISGYAYGPHGGDGKRKGPSPQAVEACAERSAGETVEFTTRSGAVKSATCREVQGRLVAVPEGRKMKERGGERLERMARALELSEAQREEIAALKEAQREKTAPLRRQMRKNREEMRRITGAETVDASAVRALTAARAELKSEMILSRTETRARVHALLTPEQREKAAEMMKKGERRGKGGFCRENG